MSEKVIKFLCYTTFLIILYVITIWVFNVEIKDIATDKGAALATMYGWMGTVFAGFIALFLFTDWKEQYNKNISAEIAQRIWSDLDKIAIKVSDLDLESNQMTDGNNNNYENKLKAESNEINSIMLRVYLDVRLLDALSGSTTYAEMVTTHYLIKISYTDTLEDMIHRVQNTYPTTFEPLEEKIKKQLKDNILA